MGGGMKKLRGTTSLFLVSCIIVSCVPNKSTLINKTPVSNTAAAPTVFGEDVFGNASCSLPCWKGLIPGQSTIDNVYEALNKLSRIGRFDISTRSGRTGYKWIRMSDNNQFVDLHMENNRLIFIELLPFDSSLKQIVDRFGPPEYFEALTAIGPDGSHYVIEVYYPKRGIAFVVAPDEKDNGFIKPDMRIVVIHCFSPGDLTSYFVSRFSWDVGRDGALAYAKTQITKFIQPWTGFGEVDVKQTH